MLPQALDVPKTGHTETATKLNWTGARQIERKMWAGQQQEDKEQLLPASQAMRTIKAHWLLALA